MIFTKKVFDFVNCKRQETPKLDHKLTLSDNVHEGINLNFITTVLLFLKPYPGIYWVHITL